MNIILPRISDQEVNISIIFLPFFLNFPTPEVNISEIFITFFASYFFFDMSPLSYFSMDNVDEVLSFMTAYIYHLFIIIRFHVISIARIQFIIFILFFINYTRYLLFITFL